MGLDESLNGAPPFGAEKIYLDYLETLLKNHPNLYILTVTHSIVNDKQIEKFKFYHCDSSIDSKTGEILYNFKILPGKSNKDISYNLAKSKGLFTYPKNKSN